MANKVCIQFFVMVALCLSTVTIGCTGSGVVAGDSNTTSPNATTQGSANTMQSSTSSRVGAATQQTNSSTSEIKLNSGSMAKPAQINR